MRLVKDKLVRNGNVLIVRVDDVAVADPDSKTVTVKGGAKWPG